MSDKGIRLALWPIITFVGLLIYKDYLMWNDWRQVWLFSLVTDCLLILLVVFLSLERASRWRQRIQTVLIILILFYHWLDTCIFIAIDNRLTLNNVIGNLAYADVFINFISARLVIFTLLIIILPILLRNYRVELPLKRSLVNLLCCEIIIVLLVGDFIINMNFSRYDTGNAINLTTSSFGATAVTQETLQASEANAAGLIEKIKAYFAGKNWQSLGQVGTTKPNLIIVVSESLSMVDSNYAGGLFNRLPKIDKLQQDGLVFKQTISNGKITPHGLAAFILGIQTTKTGGFVGMMAQFPPGKFAENNIITYAKNAGYQTIIISPGQPITFYQMIPWFKEVGFEQIYDINADIFKSAPRYTWNAPSDQAMYEAALNLLPTFRQPYLLVIETVSLHQPYILPDQKYKLGDNKLLNQINYVDGTTYEFYQKLKNSGFLTSGFFILFGDHRRFEPLEKKEIDDGGYSVWHERIVCSIVGNGIPPHSFTSLPFSLIDMNTLLHYLINGYPVNDQTLLQASLNNQIGVATPFSVSLVDDEHGTYLIRSANYPPLFVSVYGSLPFDKIPNSIYKEAVTYIIQNDLQMSNKGITSNAEIKNSW